MQTHEDIVTAIEAIVDTLDREQLVKAFVASLSTRDLRLREAFESFALLQKFERHAFDGHPSGSKTLCKICNFPDITSTPVPVNFEGFNRFSNPAAYAASVLVNFDQQGTPAPTALDREILARILDASRALPAEAGLTQLEKSLVGLFKSNKNQRIRLLEALGYIGVLCPENELDYGTGFVPFSISAARYPPGTKSDWRYPVRMWRGYAGVNEQRVELYFSRYL